MKLFLLPVFVFFTQPLFSQNQLDNVGLGAGATPAVAFSLRKLASGYEGPAVKVRRVIDNAEAEIWFNNGGEVDGSSVTRFTPGVLVSSGLGVIQSGTITSSAVKSGNININPIKSGRLSAVTSSPTVTGTETNFLGELNPGNVLYNTNNEFIGVVYSVTSNTELVLTNHASITTGITPYRTDNAILYGFSTVFTEELVQGDRLFAMDNSYLGTVIAIYNDVTALLDCRGAVSASIVGYQGTSPIISGVNTNFSSLSPGNLLISNNVTLGIIGAVYSNTIIILESRAGFPVNQQVFKKAEGVVPFSTFYASTSVFVKTWYDQSGAHRDMTQNKPNNQPRIVNAGLLHVMNGRTSMLYASSLSSFLRSSTAADYLVNTNYSLNNVTAEANTSPDNQFPLSTTGGNGQGNSILSFGYRSSAQYTMSQSGNEQNFSSAPGTTLETHTGVKLESGSSQLFKNGVDLGIFTGETPSHLTAIGLLSFGFYSSSNTYYNGSVSEMIVFPSVLQPDDISQLGSNQLAYYGIVNGSWTGTVSTEWSDPDNWSTGLVPTLTTPAMVVIPAGTPFEPVIDAAAYANSITVKTGANLSSNSFLYLAGNLNNLGTCNFLNGQVVYTGMAKQEIGLNSFLDNEVRSIIIDNPAGVNLHTDLLITSDLIFNSGYLNLGGSELTLRGNTTNNVTGGLRGDTASRLVINSPQNPVLSFDQSVNKVTNTLKNLTINCYEQPVYLGNDLVMHDSGTLTFTTGALHIGSNKLTISGAVVNTSEGGLYGESGSIVMVEGAASPTLSFNQESPGSSDQIDSLIINSPGQTVTLATPVSIGIALDLIAGTLYDNGNQLLSTGNINMTAGTFKLGNAITTTTWPGFTMRSFNPGSTVEYAGNYPTMTTLPVYENLTISGTGGVMASNNLTVNGILNLSAANPYDDRGILSTEFYELNMGGLATTVGQGDVTGVVRRNTILPNITYTMGNQYTFVLFQDEGSLPSEVSLKTAIGQTPGWKPGAIKRVFNFAHIGGSMTKALVSFHYLDSELNGNLENKLVDLSYRSPEGSEFEIGRTGFNSTQNWVALSFVDFNFFPAAFTGMQTTLDESTQSILTWTGAASSSWTNSQNWSPSEAPSYSSIVIIPYGPLTDNTPIVPALTSVGSVIIESGGILNTENNASLELTNSGLVWSNDGIFNAGSSRVVFISSGSSISGVTDFNSITINSDAEVLMNAGSVVRIAGGLDNYGIWLTNIFENTVEYNGSMQMVAYPGGLANAYHHLILSSAGPSQLPMGQLNILGDITFMGLTVSEGCTIAMKGTSGQSINGVVPINLNGLRINNSSTYVDLNLDLEIADGLTFENGGLSIGAHTLSVTGSISNLTSGGLRGSAASNLKVNSTGIFLSFDQSVPGVTNNLNELTTNLYSGSEVGLASNLKVSGTATIQTGIFDLSGYQLELGGQLVNLEGSAFRGGGMSSIVVSGGIASPVLSFDLYEQGYTNQLNRLSINSKNQMVTLNNPVVITGVIDLIDGLITPGDAEALKLGVAGTFTGGSDSSFINGGLTRVTSSTGSVIFPVGKINRYRPVTVTPIDGVYGNYVSEYFSSVTPLSSNTIGLTGMATDEYWSVQKLFGPDATVMLGYKADNTWTNSGPASTDNIYGVNYTTDDWIAVDGTVVPGNTGSGLWPLQTELLPLTGLFSFGFSPNLTLPLTLIDFSAAVVSNGIRLTWTTENEVLLLDYEVERSADGRQFNKIGQVEATNNPLVSIYNYLDISPLDGINYYRLKMNDIDGKFKYSSVVRVDVKGQKQLTVYPNPVTGNTIHLQMYGQERGRYQVSLYNQAGTRMMTKVIQHDAGNTAVAIPLNSILKGFYYLEVAGPGKDRTILKILIE
ncbi:MAG: T9SS type A sorting domain-containing protein [Chitinophagaceae bacterium]